MLGSPAWPLLEDTNTLKKRHPGDAVGCRHTSRWHKKNAKLERIVWGSKQRQTWWPTRHTFWVLSCQETLIYSEDCQFIHEVEMLILIWYAVIFNDGMLLDLILLGATNTISLLAWTIWRSRRFHLTGEAPLLQAQEGKVLFPYVGKFCLFR